MIYSHSVYLPNTQHIIWRFSRFFMMIIILLFFSFRNRTCTISIPLSYSYSLSMPWVHQFINTQHVEQPDVVILHKHNDESLHRHCLVTENTYHGRCLLHLCDAMNLKVLKIIKIHQSPAIHLKESIEFTQENLSVPIRNGIDS